MPTLGWRWLLFISSLPLLLLLGLFKVIYWTNHILLYINLTREKRYLPHTSLHGLTYNDFCLISSSAIAVQAGTAEHPKKCGGLYTRQVWEKVGGGGGVGKRENVVGL
jgi:hypothetical protein